MSVDMSLAEVGDMVEYRDGESGVIVEIADPDYGSPRWQCSRGWWHYRNGMICRSPQWPEDIIRIERAGVVISPVPAPAAGDSPAVPETEPAAEVLIRVDEEDCPHWSQRASNGWTVLYGSAGYLEPHRYPVGTRIEIHRPAPAPVPSPPEEGCESPSDVSSPKSYSFEDVNHWVHKEDPSIDELGWACLGLATELERVKAAEESGDAGEVNPFEAALRRRHNGYCEAAREAMPTLREPQSPDQALDELIEEARELAISEMKILAEYDNSTPPAAPTGDIQPAAPVEPERAVLKITQSDIGRRVRLRDSRTGRITCVGQWSATHPVTIHLDVPEGTRRGFGVRVDGLCRYGEVNVDDVVAFADLTGPFVPPTPVTPVLTIEEAAIAVVNRWSGITPDCIDEDAWDSLVAAVQAQVNAAGKAVGA